MQGFVDSIYRNISVVFSPKINLAIIATILISGCGTNMPIQKTGNANEYVLNRDDKSPFGNLPSVKRAVSIDASRFCEAMNKKSVEKYSIDKERAIMVWPESTLYFECVDQMQDSDMAAKKDTRTKDESQKSSTVYSELIKLDELRKKGILTESEFDVQKKKLLSGN